MPVNSRQVLFVLLDSRQITAREARRKTTQDQQTRGTVAEPYEETLQHQRMRAARARMLDA